MPNQPNEINISDRLLYNKVDHYPVDNGLEGVITVKIDFPSTKDFFNFVTSKAGEWQGTGKEANWVGNLIYRFDDKIRQDKSINITSLSYKDSVFDERSVVVLIARYIQE